MKLWSESHVCIIIIIIHSPYLRRAYYTILLATFFDQTAISFSFSCRPLKKSVRSFKRILQAHACDRGHFPSSEKMFFFFFLITTYFLSYILYTIVRFIYNHLVIMIEYLVAHVKSTTAVWILGAYSCLNTPSTRVYF